MCMVSRLNLLVLLQRTSVDDLDCFLIIDVPRKSARSARWRQCSDGQTCIPPLRRRSRRFNLQDCLRLSEMIKERDGRGVSVVFNTHHEECYRMSHPGETLPTIESLLPRVLETWAVAGRVPMSHVSNHSKTKSRLGAHSDFIEDFPDILFKYARSDHPS